MKIQFFKAEEELTLDDLIKGVDKVNRHELVITDEVGKEKWNTKQSS